MALSSFRWVLFSASYSKINPCFTAGKRIGVWNCHATGGQRKTIIFASSAYGFKLVTFERVHYSEKQCFLFSIHQLSKKADLYWGGTTDIRVAICQWSLFWQSTSSSVCAPYTPVLTLMPPGSNFSTEFPLTHGKPLLENFNIVWKIDVLLHCVSSSKTLGGGIVAGRKVAGRPQPRVHVNLPYHTYYIVMKTRKTALQLASGGRFHIFVGSWGSSGQLLVHAMSRGSTTYNDDVIEALLCH
jgi:hypothetical protein